MTVAHKRAKKRDIEGPIHRSSLNFLLWQLPKRAVVHHSPNELDMAGKDAARQVAKARDLGTKPGWPDLEIIYEGRAFFIEMKPEGRGLTGEQPSCHEQLRAAGAKVAISHSIDETEAILIEWGLLRPKNSMAQREPDRPVNGLT